MTATITYYPKRCGEGSVGTVTRWMYPRAFKHCTGSSYMEKEKQMKSTRPNWMTAIKRKTVSLPIREHLIDFLSDPCKRVLDYGCGRGFDADALGMFKYDPYYFASKPAGTFHHVYCGYVLNVMTQKEGQTVVDEMQKLLKPRGTGYIVVRRDQKKDNPNQRQVQLDGACMFTDNSKYTIYSFWKDKEVTVR